MVNILQFICSIFSKPKEAKSLGKISIKSVSELLSKYRPSDKTFLSDNIFDTTSVDNGQKFMAETLVSNRKYIKEGHDCDNFSFAAMGYWSGGLYSARSARPRPERRGATLHDAPHPTRS